MPSCNSAPNFECFYFIASSETPVREGARREPKCTPTVPHSIRNKRRPKINNCCQGREERSGVVRKKIRGAERYPSWPLHNNTTCPEQGPQSQPRRNHKPGLPFCFSNDESLGPSTKLNAKHAHKPCSGWFLMPTLRQSIRSFHSSQSVYINPLIQKLAQLKKHPVVIGMLQRQTFQQIETL
jgi:hypothetical protein